MPTDRIFKLETEQNILIVIPLGDVSSLEEDEILTEVQGIIDTLGTGAPTNLIVDLKLAPFFGSTMLGALIKLWQAVTAHHRKMVLCCASDFEMDVLQATKLDGVWPHFASRAEALVALK